MANASSNIETTEIAPGLASPCVTKADELVASCRAAFRRHLAAWATDCLAVRRAGLDVMQWSPSDRVQDQLNLAA